MLLEIVYASRGEWCVTVDGRQVVGFAGPDARERAERHRDELESLLLSGAGRAEADEGPDAAAPEAEAGEGRTPAGQ